MKLHFRKEEEYFTLHDPTQEGKLIQRKTEIRFDPLTQETSRVIFDPGTKFTPPDYTELAQTSGGKNCPFCPENILRITPTFPSSLIDGGRVVREQAIAFPNLFPYSKHNAVTVFSEQHYVRLEEFTAPMIANAFATAHTYLQRVVDTDPQTKYASLNWNYLPPSGGSILHPHIHVLASEQPTNYQALTTKQSEQFYLNHQQNYYLALKETEQESQERWIGAKGSISWLHAFAPKSHCDFVGIFHDAPSLSGLNEQTWKDLGESMLRFFRYYQQLGIASFNFSLFIPVTETPNQWVHARIIPRLTIGALGTSDMNVFTLLHQEPLSLKVPEQVAQEVAVYF